LQAALSYQQKKIPPLNNFLISPPTLISSLLNLHPPFITLNPTPFVIHPIFFNFQPHSRGWSLTSKKHFLLLFIFALRSSRNCTRFGVVGLLSTWDIGWTAATALQFVKTCSVDSTGAEQGLHAGPALQG
jgi:hypothetical protein